MCRAMFSLDLALTTGSRTFEEAAKNTRDRKNLS